MRSYHNTAQSLMTNSRHVTIEPIRRKLNSQADMLAKGAASGEHPKKTELVMMEDMTEGKGPERLYKVNIVDVGEVSNKAGGWMKEIIDFLRESTFSNDKVKA